jgi:hypothetical protein
MLNEIAKPSWSREQNPGNTECEQNAKIIDHPGLMGRHEGFDSQHGTILFFLFERSSIAKAPSTSGQFGTRLLREGVAGAINRLTSPSQNLITSLLIGFENGA